MSRKGKVDLEYGGGRLSIKSFCSIFLIEAGFEATDNPIEEFLTKYKGRFTIEDNEIWEVVDE